MTIQADLQAYVSNYIKFSYASQGKESGGNVKFLEIVGGERREEYRKHEIKRETRKSGTDVR